MGYSVAEVHWKVIFNLVWSNDTLLTPLSSVFEALRFSSVSSMLLKVLSRAAKSPKGRTIIFLERGDMKNIEKKLFAGTENTK